MILEKTEHLLRPIKEFNSNGGVLGGVSAYDDYIRNSIEEIIGNPSVIKPKFKQPIPPINSTTVN
jgi:hypothetical protein